MDSAAGAGFYSDGYGYLPWAWGTGEVDLFELWMVTKPRPQRDLEQVVPRRRAPTGG
jgi:hypothetical protein